MASKEKDTGIFKPTPNTMYWNDHIIIKYGEVKPEIKEKDMISKLKIIKTVTKHSLDSNWEGKHNYSIIIASDKAFDLLEKK